MQPRRPSWVIRVLFTVTWTAVLMALAVAAFEAYWRRFGFDPNAYYTWPPGFHMVFKADPQAMPGVAGPADFLINGLGLRGDVPGLRQRRYLAIGGSTTEDAFLKLENSWTYQLQRRMAGSWVGNMGKAGTNSRHHALAAERILPRLPNIDVVIVLVGLNDMLFDLGLHHPPNLGPEWDLGQTFAYRPAENAALLDRFAVYHLGVNTWRNWQVSPEAVRTVDGSFFGDYKRRRTRVHPEDWVDVLPAMMPFLGKYRQNLMRIMLAAQGAQVVFVTQPSLWTSRPTAEQLTQMYMGGFGSPDVWRDPHNKWMTPQAMLRALTAYNQETLDFCADRHLSCIDLASELPKQATFFYDDAHFSDAGAAAVATILARHLSRDVSGGYQHTSMNVHRGE